MIASNFGGPMPGYVLAQWWHDAYYSADKVIDEMHNSGVQYVEIVITRYMNDLHDRGIYVDSQKTPTDDSVAHVISYIKKKGMTPILKPHVDLYSGDWRGEIGKYYSTQDWKDFFWNYTQFITHYADLANKHGATNIFNVGTELDGTEGHSDEWREVIRNVRKELPAHTQILYGCNWYPDVNAVNWWDAVDLIGVDAYYPLSQKTNPSLSELKSAWKPIMDNLHQTSKKFGNKKIVFAEAGYASYPDAAKHPNLCCYGSNDNDLQARLYQAFFEEVWGQPWFGGVFWWDWDAYKSDTDYWSTNFDTLGKPAQSIYESYYKGHSMEDFLQ